MKMKDILARDNNCCRLCLSNNLPLQIHHLTPKEINGDNSDRNLITLCISCHKFMHCNPMLVMKSKEKISSSIKNALDRAKIEGKKLGRPKGKKDSKVRKKEGYYLRWHR